VPRDFPYRIDLRVQGSMTNHGPAPAYIELNGDAQFELSSALGELPEPRRGTVLDHSTGKRARIDPGETLPFIFQSGRSLQEWLDAFDHQTEAPPTSFLRCEVIVDDHRDNGVVDNIFVVMQGYPIWRKRDDLGSCFVAPQPTVTAWVEPHERKHFLSKQKELLIED
jgi:hypothetical protein